MLANPEVGIIPKLRRAGPRIIAALVLSLPACSDGDSNAEPSTTTQKSDATAATTDLPYIVPSEKGLPIPEVDLPEPIQIDTKTESQCLNPPRNTDTEGVSATGGIRMERIGDKDYLLGILDGSCNVPLADARIGLYKRANQSSNPALIARNGQQVLFECYSNHETNQEISDIKPGSASKVWWQIIYENPATGANERWLVPEVNVIGDDISAAQAEPCP